MARAGVGTDTLPLEARGKPWRNSGAGGTVISVGARPANSETELPSPRVQAIARALFGDGDGPSMVTNKAGGTAILLPDGMLGLTTKTIDALLERDAACADAKAPVKVTRRRIDGCGLSGTHARCAFRFAAPTTGTMFTYY